jgi:hypothetical protein
MIISLSSGDHLGRLRAAFPEKSANFTLPQFQDEYT